MSKERTPVRKVSVLLVAILLIAAAQFVVTTPTALGSASTRRFGFVIWDPASRLGGAGQYDPNTFFNAMFLTPPYPSTIWFVAGQNNIGWIEQVGQDAVPYPNVKMLVTLGFDANDTACAIYHDWCWSDIEGSVLPAMAPSAFYGIGFGFEYADQASHVTAPPGSPAYVGFWNQQLQRLATDAAKYGWSEVNYYSEPSGSTTPANTYGIEGVDGIGCSCANLGGSSFDIAQFAEGDVPLPFPAPGCNSVGDGAWSVTAYAQGYQPTNWSQLNSAPCNYSSPPTVAWFLGGATKQNVYFSAGQDSVAFYCDSAAKVVCGYNTSGGAGLITFTGVSGLSTYQNWDLPAFRDAMSNWVAANPSIYLTSIGEVPPGGPTTTTTLGGNQTSSTSTESRATTSNSSVTSQSTTSASTSVSTTATTTLRLTTTATSASSSASTTYLSSGTSASGPNPLLSTTTTSTSTANTPSAHYNFQTTTTSTPGPASSSSTLTTSSAQSTSQVTSSTARAASRQGAYSGSPLETDIPFVPAFLGIGAGALLGFAFLTGLERSGFSWNASLEQRRRQLNELSAGPRRARLLVRVGSSVTEFISALIRIVSRTYSRKGAAGDSQ
jgi:hypothetical protein